MPKGKHKGAKAKKDKRPIDVEDHGNGFMFVGTQDINKARKMLADYVDNPEDYRFAARTWYEQRASAVWLSTHPAAAWDGAVDHIGRPLPR